MLVVRAVEDQPNAGIKKGDKFRFYIVDSHHHMGREKSHRNTPPGAYDFFALLWFEMQRMARDLLDEDKLLFEPLDVIPTPFPSSCFDSKASWARMNHGWLVDRVIVFPFSDDYAISKGPESASFNVSNDKIAGWTTRAPHSTRLIGFARVDPQDGTKGTHNLAVRELKRAVSDLGLRGLKLHPLAQLFLDELDQDVTIRVVKAAGELGIPIIFDTRNIRTVVKIRNLVNIMRENPKYEKCLAQLKIILAHCGMSPGDARLYEALRDPILSADTSTLHGNDVPLLFRMAKDRLTGGGVHWSQKLLFGTDYSFLSVQAAELILHLLSRNFPGTLADVQRILGGNAMSIVQKPFSTSASEDRTPRQVSSKGAKGRTREKLESTILSHVSSGKIDIASLDFMLPPANTWPEPISLDNGGYNGIHFESYVIAMRSRDNGGEFHIWVRSHPGDLVSFAVLGGKQSLSKSELALQKLDPSILKSLASHSEFFASRKDFFSAVSDMLV
ncbi:MAG: amidohydrolase family protein [Candidatus Thorarchaeota archaeon]|jgi:predicted TIM-barrel fold metal-dependent hydrolase